MQTNTKKLIKEKGILNTIYKPNGRAAEYGEYDLNIYDGCPHACKYCYAPNCLHKDRDAFHTDCKPRPNIVEQTAKRLEKGDVKGKHIFLCFTCDPFPMSVDHTPTRQIIKLIHDSGNFVQILTKGILLYKDFSLLNENDIFGVSVSASDEASSIVEPNAAETTERLAGLSVIKERCKCKTFVSCEPVLEAEEIYKIITYADKIGIDELKIGKLNYHKPSDFSLPDINWGDFGRECERLCKEHGRNYYIKESLRAEMNKDIVERGKKNESRYI